MPEGSSSAAPVIRPGPKLAKKCRTGFLFGSSISGGTPALIYDYQYEQSHGARVRCAGTVVDWAQRLMPIPQCSHLGFTLDGYASQAMKDYGITGRYGAQSLASHRARGEGAH